MAQSSTMNPLFGHNETNSASLLQRRQQTAPFLQSLELPSLPPLSQLMMVDNSDKKTATTRHIKTETHLPPLPTVAVTPNTQAQIEAIASMEAAATASMITSTAQPLIQQTFSSGNLTHTSVTAIPSTIVLPSNTAITSSLLYHPSETNKSTTLSFATAATPENSIIDNSTRPITTHPLNQTLVGMTQQQQQHMYHAAAVVAAATANAGLMTEHQHHGYHTTNTMIPPSFIDPNTTTQQQREGSVSSTDSNKMYNFVAIPGINQRKRPRRRYDEIERLYHCNWIGCTKSYGTLNHLNAHVSMQQHGPKRYPTEFKEMRKEWRRQKKERDLAKKQQATEAVAAAAATAAATATINYRQQQQQQQLFGNLVVPPPQVSQQHSNPPPLINTLYHPPHPHHQNPYTMNQHVGSSLHGDGSFYL